MTQIIDNALRICAEVMRAVIVDEDAGVIVVIVGVATDVVAFFNDQTALAQLTGDTLSKH